MGRYGVCGSVGFCGIDRDDCGSSASAVAVDVAVLSSGAAYSLSGLVSLTSTGCPIFLCLLLTISW